MTSFPTVHNSFLILVYAIKLNLLSHHWSKCPTERSATLGHVPSYNLSCFQGNRVCLRCYRPKSVFLFSSKTFRFALIHSHPQCLSSRDGKQHRSRKIHRSILTDGFDVLPKIYSSSLWFVSNSSSRSHTYILNRSHAHKSVSASLFPSVHTT